MCAGQQKAYPIVPIPLVPETRELGELVAVSIDHILEAAGDSAERFVHLVRPDADLLDVGLVALDLFGIVQALVGGLLEPRLFLWSGASAGFPSGEDVLDVLVGESGSCRHGRRGRVLCAVAGHRRLRRRFDLFIQPSNQCKEGLRRACMRMCRQS